MPEELDECVESVMEDGHDESSAYAICQAEQKAKEQGIDPKAARSVAKYMVTDEWSGIHPAETTKSGREHLVDEYGGFVEKALSEARERQETAVKFKARLPSQMRVLYKQDGKIGIWGPASVDVVDKENDRVTPEALEKALPQLLRRSSLSLEHSDQIVGDIKRKFEFEEPKTVEINGNTYERSEFPTDVLDKEEDDVPETGLYVAGEVWSDTKQAEETQKNIENGVIDSYSISGEAIESSSKMKDGEMVDNIERMDLSAVTLCEEGMNQRAKFARVKSLGSRDEIRALAKSGTRQAAQESMAKEDDGEDEEEEPSNASEEAADEMAEEMDKSDLEDLFKESAKEVLKDELPSDELATKDDLPSDGDLVTRSDVEAIVEEKMESTEKMPGEDDEEEVDPDEIEDPDDDDEEELDIGGDDEEMPPEEESDDKASEPLGESMADDEEAEALDDEEDDESGDEPPEMEEEPEDTPKGHRVDLDTLKSELPDDLYSAVAEHMSDPGEGQIEMEDDEDEDEGDMDEEDEDVEKAASDLDSYMAEVSTNEITIGGSEQSMEKSVAGTEEEIEKSVSGDVPETDEESDALAAFYDNIEG